MAYVRAATIDEIAEHGLRSDIDRREFLKLAGVIGLNAALAACGGRTATSPSDVPNPGGGGDPNPVPDGVETEKQIVGLYTGNSAGNGNYLIAGLNIPIVDGKIKVTRDMGLKPGQYIAAITTTLGYDRHAIVDVSPDGIMSINLGGGRRENTITVREKGSLNEDFGLVALRKGVSPRSETPLQIGLLDMFVYRGDGRGGLIRDGPHTMNETARTTLYDVLRNDPALLSDGLYQTGDFFKVQSRGYTIPENEQENGWLIIFPYKNIRDRWIIAQADTAADGKGPNITNASMGFRPNFAITRRDWGLDTMQCIGYAGDNPIIEDRAYDSSGRIMPGMEKNAKFKFRRPPGLELDDKAVTYNPSLGR